MVEKNKIGITIIKNDSEHYTKNTVQDAVMSLNEVAITLAEKNTVVDKRLTDYIQIVSNEFATLRSRIDELENTRTLGFIIVNTVRQSLNKYRNWRVRRLKNKVARYTNDRYYK